MVKTGNDLNEYAVSSLIDMYSKCYCFEDACMVYNGSCCGMDVICKNVMVAAFCRNGEVEKGQKMFWEGPELNDTVSWNTMISGYAQNGYVKEALELFAQMRENGIWWNEHTLASVLSACSSLRS
ncbi:hypothetical protein GIB67_028159 [Kingdonia uniflora]|uniref:Pentatricopeptide repeat-containing protein n=1 Tax=Kingdonia uniflora TaxID=39325 RepID=A0A7J7KZN2_9MAGN|nr:hypothetical protein GIB67_028159 [Kingdonia uniflora]